MHAQSFPFACLICQRNYPSEKSLNYHKIIHTRPNYYCEKCEKSFFYSDKLKKHLITCGIQWTCSCGRVFVRKKWYDRHMEEHDVSKYLSEKKIIEVKPTALKYIFKCRHCKKGMKKRKTLEVHEQTVHKPLV
ncbi:Zn-finger [Trachipleistophora hominis]|uniref:Zn-finger n=1 Tax=Trachipleistophora hominis TaxID=72359 RepID=L7JSC1_TRAHO|nr:Zn-finger [Trachipleistophora hominis]